VVNRTVKLMKQIKFYLTFLMLFVNVCCSFSSVNLPVEKVKNFVDEPSETVIKFFQPSEKIEETNSLVRPYPERFVECLFMNPEDCSIKRLKKQKSSQKTEENSNMSRVTSMGENELSLRIENYQQKIQSNQIFFKQINSVWTVNDESRVRVELEIKGKKLIKDLLLFREKRWQIIEIANENEYLYYAQPFESKEGF
jgi:hypothetical protein